MNQIETGTTHDAPQAAPSALIAPSPVAAAPNGYTKILNDKLAAGARAAARVMETLHTDVPTDQIVLARAVRYGIAPAGGLQLGVGQDVYTPSDYALGQLAGRAGVPTAYLRELAQAGVVEATAWRNHLAAHILTQHFGAAGDTRALVRSVRGQIRGYLSDHFRRLDSRPLVEALAEVAQEVGAVPCDGTATETRVALKLIMPEIVEPIPGEYLVYGAEWSNSDYGNGTHAFRAYALRVVCLNGMVRENILRQVHLGGRLAEDVAFSDQTYRLDTAASVSALRDVVRGALGPAGRESLTAKIRAAHETAYTGRQLAAAARNQPKAVAKSIVDAYESLDVINLPPGNTAWRASNAVSWIARHTEDAERRLDLERLAGVVSGAPAVADTQA